MMKKGNFWVCDGLSGDAGGPGGARASFADVVMIASKLAFLKT